ncbi:hypothetical protein AB0M36_35280 [Actinoplanes sp. NPDC051346]|uniref:hypothetical protein n=1 Tax=Actinoplanes sp. NPDC051346 TaxID=3155048 RepID=UPI003443B999
MPDLDLCRREEVEHVGHRLAGQLRKKKIKGDPWELAVAAERSSLAEVKAANGIPASVQSYVDEVAGYADWYSDQSVFRIGQGPKPGAGPATTPLKVPDDLVADINAAGVICPRVTPARVAAQLRAASNFDANRRSEGANEGIAPVHSGVVGHVQGQEGFRLGPARRDRRAGCRHVRPQQAVLRSQRR